MSSKNNNSNKNKDDAQRNKAKGRRDGEPAQQNNAGRERNLGHKKGEEHSVKPKGGAGNWSGGRR
jgi:hypothetical protein